MSTPTERKIAARVIRHAVENPHLPLDALLELAAQEGYYTGTRNALRDHRMDDGAFNRTLRRLERVKARMPRKQAPVEEAADITDRHLEDLGARLAQGVVVPDELYIPIRATVLAAVEEALRTQAPVEETTAERWRRIGQEYTANRAQVPVEAPSLDEDAVNPLPADDSYLNGSVEEDQAVARAEQYYRRTSQEYRNLPQHERIPGAPLRDTLRWMIRNGAKV